MSLKFVIGLGWLSRGVGILLLIVNTRLLIELVGPRGFAAHAIIASFTTWLALLNLGVPSSVQNLVSRWRAEKRPYDDLLQTAASFTLICAIAGSPLVLLAAYLVHHLLLAQFEFTSLAALFLAFECLFLGGLGLVFMNMLHSEHRSIWPNLYPAATAIAVFALLLFCRTQGINDFNLILSLYFVPNALFAVAAFLLLRLDRRITINRDILRQVLSGARGFATIATLGTLTLSVDYAILSRLLPADDVVAYSLTSRMFLVIQVIHAVVLSSAWTPLSDLYFARSLQSARRRALQLGLLGVTMSLCWSAVVMLGAPQFYRLLAPNMTIVVSTGFLFLWTAYITVRVWSDTFYVVMQSFGDTQALRKYMIFQAPISIVLQWLLGTHYGMEGLLIGVALSFILTCAWYLPLRTLALTRPEH